MEGTTAALSLWSSPDTREENRSRLAYAPLWLSIYLPKLALEVFATDDKRIARAIVTESDQRPTIHAVSAAAQRTGVMPGMSLAQAYALCPRLDVRVRDRERETDRLAQVAAWALRFTSTVSIQPPQSLLLEIRGSLRLFGGLSALQKELHKSLVAQSIYFQTAVAPTPQGSLLLARYGRITPTFDHTALRSALGRLPITALSLGAKETKRLTNIGIRNLYELFRLPREGLARRFGAEFVCDLDRTLGLAPDPRRVFRPSHRFAAEMTLSAEVTDTNLILAVARQLLSGLAKFLRKRDVAVHRLHIDLHHLHYPISRTTIGVRCGTRDDKQLLALLSEHLNRLRLPAPVIKLSLATEAIQPFTTESKPLFGNREAVVCNGSSQDWRELFDRLEARLGKAVHSISLRADHRPEFAWGYQKRITPTSVFASNTRPLWLLSCPQRLKARQGHPQHCGPLTLEGNAERIEGGWWDGKDIRRDYYIALDTDGSRLWVFWDLSGGEWYLHGLFA
jgi:protein ImuB